MSKMSVWGRARELESRGWQNVDPVYRVGGLNFFL